MAQRQRVVDHSCVLGSDVEKYKGRRSHTNTWNIANSSVARLCTGSKAQNPLQEGCIKCTWMPNWANNTTFSVPSGFALALDRNSARAVISPYLFHDPSKYAYGTLVIPLPADGKTKREGMLITDYVRSHDKMASSGGGFRRLPSSKRLLEKTHDLIPSKWLEHGGSFAGLYASSDRKNDFAEKLWVVVQASDAAASLEANRVLHRTGSTGTREFNTTNSSWNKFVERSNSPFGKAKAAGKKRRNELANIILDDLLGFDHKGRDISAYGPVTTVTNVFSRLRYSGKTQVFYSGCTPAKHGGEKGRVILNESPRTGIFVLHGVKPVIKCLGAFPYGTGRKASMAPSSVRARAENPGTPPPDNVFCWDDDDDDKIHPRLYAPVPELFRLRTKEFRQVELNLGRDPVSRVIHLRPIAVKMADP